jgi:hypothetical protein
MRHLALVLVLAMSPACGFNSGGSDDDSGDDEGIAPPYEPPFGDCGGGAADDPPPDTAVCYGDIDPTTPTDPFEQPLLVIEHELTSYEGVDAVHIILTFNPTFVDNTYGTGAVGWERDHKFRDLVGSDHAQLTIFDGAGELAFDLKLDYLSEDPEAPCGYSSGGVARGEGKVNFGDADAILGWSSSLDRNLNERGYCEDYLENSPATDENCTANADAPDWDFRVVYEVWIALSAFDPAGFGLATMQSVHASPAKGGENTVEVTPEDCPCVEIDPGDCDDTPPPDGDECSVDEECATGEFCEGGHCLPIVD